MRDIARHSYLGFLFPVAASISLQASALAEELPTYLLPAYEDDRGHSITPSISLEAAFFPQSQSWFGESEANLGDKSDHWFEEALTLAVDGRLSLGGNGYLYGRASGILTASQRTDAAGSNLPDDNIDDVALEDVYVGWSSGELLVDSLGIDTLDLSYGQQKYEVGTGFLFDDGGSDGRQRGAYWIGARRAFEQAAIARVEAGGLLARAVFLEPNDRADTDTRIYGFDLEWSEEDLVTAGLGYYNIFESETDSRDGMDVFDVRVQTTPLGRGEFLPGLTLAGEFAKEENGSRQEGQGYYGEIGYDFGDATSWAPYLSYRYAHFSGDDPDTSKDDGFDPLLYGFTDWGTWFQGEILGEYVLLNQNLNSHTVRLRMTPADKLTVNLLYFHFWLDEAEGFGVSDSDFADEIDLIVDYTLNDNISFSLVGAAAEPHEGAEEFTGGDEVWYYGMLYTKISF